MSSDAAIARSAAVSTRFSRSAPENPEVRAAIAAAGLELAALYGHDQAGVPAQPMNEATHTKAIYIVRKPGR